jgi:hypothetical protein
MTPPEQTETNGTIPNENGGIPKPPAESVVVSEEVTQRLTEIEARRRGEWRGLGGLTLGRKLDKWAGDDPHSRYAVERVKEQIDHDARDKVNDLAARLDDLGHTCAMAVRVFEGGYGATGQRFYEAAETLGYDSPEGHQKLGLRDVAAAWELFSLALSNASERLRNAGHRVVKNDDDFGGDDIPI